MMITFLWLSCAAEDGNDGDAKVGADVLAENGNAGGTSSQQIDLRIESTYYEFLKFFVPKQALKVVWKK